MNTKAPDLLPCPFCGGVPDVIYEAAGGPATGCPNACDIDMLVHEWNRRTPYPRAAFGGEATQAQVWRDIGTAPKDGSYFLVSVIYYCGTSQQHVVKFDTKGRLVHTSGSCLPLDVWPTHWMPLPAGPEVTP